MSLAAITAEELFFWSKRGEETAREWCWREGTAKHRERLQTALDAPSSDRR